MEQWDQEAKAAKKTTDQQLKWKPNTIIKFSYCLQP
jgi:hypothetical protein